MYLKYILRHISHDFLKFLKLPSSHPPEVLSYLSKQFPLINCSPFQLGSMLMYIENHITTFEAHEVLLASIKASYYGNPHNYTPGNLAFLLVMLHRKQCPDAEFFFQVLDDLKPRISDLNIREICWAIETITNTNYKIPGDTIDPYYTRILQLEGSMSNTDVSKLSQKLTRMDEKFYNIKVFEFIEKEMLRNISLMNLNDINNCLKLISKVVLIYSSDIYNITQDYIIKLAPKSSANEVCRTLSIYSSIPIHYHYTRLYEGLAAEIVSNPCKYFSTNYCIISIAHAYAKYDKNDRIIELFITHLPKVPDDLINDKNSLGYFIYSILRKPPSSAYESMILALLFDQSDHLNIFIKKKIVACMSLRPTPCQEFWDNVHKLNVKWKSEEAIFIKNVKDVLIRYNLLTN
jgi:hypothetical protein